jgi:hypothetical protein
MRVWTKLASTAVIAALVGCGASPAPSPNGGDIDDLVAGTGNIDTNLTPGLVQTSQPTVKVVADPIANGGAGWACTETSYSLTNEPSKYVVVNPNADVMWPGSLVQGKSLQGGLLDPIPVKRAPGTITLTIAGGASGTFSQTMPEASLSNATQAMNTILASYNGGTPSKFSYLSESVYSSDQLRVSVDANVSGETWSASGSLTFDSSTVKSHYLIKFSQEYFTMAFQPPEGAHGVFDPSVTSKNLEPYVGPSNPPVYIGSVTYGRIFYLLFESSASQTDLEAAVKAAYNGGAVAANGSVDVTKQDIINQSTVTAYGLGGDAKAGIKAATGTNQFEQIGSFLTEGADFTPQNPGVPISYTVRYLGDSSEVKLGLTTDFTAKNCVPNVAGCDGAVGSGKVADACGVCGGDGSTCTKPCAAGELDYGGSNGAFVAFHVAANTDGKTVTFADGNHEEYHFPTCRDITWANVVAVCHNGAWSAPGASVYTDASCTSSNNDTWSSGSNYISAGFKP